ncbi:MAG: hypothetical protein U0R79_07820 [Propionicimonas sp.]
MAYPRRNLLGRSMKDDRSGAVPQNWPHSAAGVHAFCIANANLDTDHQVEILLTTNTESSSDAASRAPP